MSNQNKTFENAQKKITSSLKSQQNTDFLLIFSHKKTSMLKVYAIIYKLSRMKLQISTDSFIHMVLSF